jgi:hypothetical protein
MFLFFAVLIGFLYWLRKLALKKRLREGLGRDVSDRELTSLSSWMQASPKDETSEAKPASPAAAAVPPKHLSKTTKRVLLAGVAALVLVAAAFLAVESMSERTWNSLNPFAPKLPPGAFPDTIAGYSKEPETYYTDRRSFSYGYEFSTYYKSSDGKLVKYSLIDYGSPDQAKKGVQQKGYFGSGGRVAQQEDGRIVGTDPNNGGTIIAEAVGPRMVQLSSAHPQDVVEFENNLPYTALGVSQPQHHSAASIDEVIPALSLLSEFQRDKNAFTKKYDGKTFLFTGMVAGVSKSGEGKPLIAIQKEGEKVGLKSIVACAFQPSEEAKVSALKKDQVAHFRCRVQYTEQLEFFTLEDCQLE